MDINSLYKLLNSGIPSEAIGGLIATTIEGLFNKATSYFKDKPITIDTTQTLINTDNEFKQIIEELLFEMRKSNSTTLINEADKIEIKNQFINSTFHNTTF